MDEAYYIIKQTLEMSSTLEPALYRLSEECKKFRKYSDFRKIALFQTLAKDAVGNLNACSSYLYIMYPLVDTLMEARASDISGKEELGEACCENDVIGFSSYESNPLVIY